MTRWQGGFVRVGSGLRHFFLQISSFFFVFNDRMYICAMESQSGGGIFMSVFFKYPVMALLHQRVRGMDERG